MHHAARLDEHVKCGGAHCQAGLQEISGQAEAAWAQAQAAFAGSSLGSPAGHPLMAANNAACRQQAAGKQHMAALSLDTALHLLPGQLPTAMSHSTHSQPRSFLVQAVPAVHALKMQQL